MSMNEQPVESPVKDNQPILLHFAPVWKRILAYIVDMGFLKTIEITMIWIVFSNEINAIYQMKGTFEQQYQLMTNFFMGHSDLLLIAMVIVEASYFILMWFGGNQTLGMKLLKIAVIDASNRKLNILMCILRYFLLFLAAQLLYIPLIFVVNPVYHQRIHDFLTGTVVVEIPKHDDLEKDTSEEEKKAMDEIPD
ncbi:MAG: RDD family protein [Brevinematales bacterium]|nr:RDD family protein [Brevinematales bacterium]